MVRIHSFRSSLVVRIPSFGTWIQTHLLPSTCHAQHFQLWTSTFSAVCSLYHDRLINHRIHQVMCVNLAVVNWGLTLHYQQKFGCQSQYILSIKALSIYQVCQLTIIIYHQSSTICLMLQQPINSCINMWSKYSLCFINLYKLDQLHQVYQTFLYISPYGGTPKSSKSLNHDDWGSPMRPMTPPFFMSKDTGWWYTQMDLKMDLKIGKSE